MTVATDHHERAAELRNALADRLVHESTIRTGGVEAAVRSVPRHCFVPQASLGAAYADESVYIKADGQGTPISAASRPTIVALMLEQP